MSDEKSECTGIAAGWCPNCGTCTCPRNDRGERIPEAESAACPLHGVDTKHAATLCPDCGDIVAVEGRCAPCEVTHLRAIIEGRSTAPTAREVALHGRWLARFDGCLMLIEAWVDRGGRVHFSYDDGSEKGGSLYPDRTPVARWWCVNSDLREAAALVAWPVAR